MASTSKVEINLLSKLQVQIVKESMVESINKSFKEMLLDHRCSRTVKKNKYCQFSGSRITFYSSILHINLKFTISQWFVVRKVLKN